MRDILQQMKTEFELKFNKKHDFYFQMPLFKATSFLSQQHLYSMKMSTNVQRM